MLLEPPRGHFISLEGIDGSGKSTHLRFIRHWLVQRGIDVVFTREPGGTPLGEKIRELLLAVDTEASLDTETLLLFASRQQLLSSVIEPALAAGQWLVSDRFIDSTFAFQGGGRGVPFERIAQLEKWMKLSLQPDLTLLFDLPGDMAVERMAKTRTLDRFEREAADFHVRVRDAYLRRAAGQRRFVVLDASRSISDIQLEVASCLQKLLETE